MRYVTKTKSIGIVGGTFDPIHLGHLHLANQVRNNCALDQIIFVPCHQSPLRTAPQANDQQRLKMLQLALEDFPYFSIDDYEVRKQKISYTFETLQYLRANHPNDSLNVIMGIDAFCRFNEWYKWNEILDLAHIIVTNRPNAPQIENSQLKQLIKAKQTFSCGALHNEFNGTVFFTEIHPLAISSTQIRALIREGKDASSLLPLKVWQYVLEHGLYM